MADPLSVIFKTNPGRRVAIGTVLLDATVSERHSYTSEVTQHPIENGGFVTDHVYEAPRSVIVTGEITDSPVVFFSAINSIRNLLSENETVSRSVEAYDQLLEIYKSHDVVTLVTGLKIYTDMVMKSFDVPKDQRTGKRLQFTAEFEEVRKVTSEIVGVADNVSDENKDKVSNEKDVGKQETTDATDPQAEKAAEKSLLFSLVGG